jgi:hypothetical protein
MGAKSVAILFFMCISVGVGAADRRPHRASQICYNFMYLLSESIAEFQTVHPDFPVLDSDDEDTEKTIGFARKNGGNKELIGRMHDFARQSEIVVESIQQRIAVIDSLIANEKEVPPDLENLRDEYALLTVGRKFYSNLPNQFKAAARAMDAGSK